MLFKKMRAVAQVIGFLCIVYLAVYGGVTLITGAPPAWAANPRATTAFTPQYISYQGILRDPADKLASGTYTMTVTIYDAASGGNLVWGPETHTGVDVRDGQFNLLLGQSTPLDPIVFTKPDRFVQLTVDGVVMNPTQRLAAVPYAMAATYATTLSAPDGDPTNALSVGTGGNVLVGDGSSSHDLRVQKGGVCIDSDGTCQSAGDGSLRVGPGGIHGTNASNSDLYLVPDSGGNVGIGITATLGAALSVDGTVRAVGDDTGAEYTEIQHDGQNSYINAVGDGTLSFGHDGTTLMSLTDSGTLSVIGPVRGAAATETEYVEMRHGGANGYINKVGDGDLDFRHDNTTLMSLSDIGNLNVDGDIAWGGNLSSLTLSDEYSASSNWEGTVSQNMVNTSHSLCFLSHVQFHDIDDATEHTSCWITQSSGKWRLNAYADGDGDDAIAVCKARCLQW